MTNPAAHNAGSIPPRITQGPRRAYSSDEADALLVGIDKGQQLADHFPSEEALEPSRQILVGELTPDEARAEILAKYSE